MRELLYNAGGHLQRGRKLAAAGDRRGALAAYAEALRDLHAVRPQRQRDALLAHVYLARYKLAADRFESAAQHDLRIGYSYARTGGEPGVRALAEELWGDFLAEREKRTARAEPKAS